jgi:hypothetical protein
MVVGQKKLNGVLGNAIGRDLLVYLLGIHISTTSHKE